MSIARISIARIILALVSFAALAMASWQRTESTPSNTDLVAFRRWFSFLAESRYFAKKTVHEVPDGQGLVRWAWKNALVPHDRTWFRSTELPVVPAMAQATLSVPNISLGDLPPRHFVSLDAADLERGDLLLYGRPGAQLTVMVFIGRSQIVPAPGTWVVYCAGPPKHGVALQVHRLSFDSLLNDPSLGWRPVADNPEFLGVWRLDL